MATPSRCYTGAIRDQHGDAIATDLDRTATAAAEADRKPATSSAARVRAAALRLHHSVVRDALADGLDWWAVGELLAMHPQATFEEYANLADSTVTTQGHHVLQLQQASERRPPLAVGWWMLVIVGLTGMGLVVVWFYLIFKEQSRQPSSAAFLAVAGLLAAVAQVFLAVLQLRQGGRPDAAELAPDKQGGRRARDQLQQHLGRQDQLRRVDETSALALRVHPAISLPQRLQPAATEGAETDSRPRSRRRLLLPRP